MMSAYSVRKGKANERAIAKAFRTVVPDARRGLSQARGGGAEESDVVLPLLHIEAKDQRWVSIWAAMRQAVEDCPPDKLPAVVAKQSWTERLVVMRLDDFVSLFGDVLKAREGR